MYMRTSGGKMVENRRLFSLINLVFLALMVLYSMPSVALTQELRSETTPVKPVRNTQSGRINVTFINPGISNPNDPTGAFWFTVSKFMKAAAEQLNINLEILYAERDHIRMQQQARMVAARSTLPDYLIVVNEKLAADDMVKVADRAGLKVFVMFNSFFGVQAKQMGKPRSKYKNWIGSLVPDFKVGGYQIARWTIDKAIEAGATKNGHLLIFAITGDAVTQSAVQRVSGLQQAVAEYPNVQLQQVFNGEWRQDIARQQTEIALRRYPKTGAIWAANDPIALGAIEGAEEATRHPGKDIFIGGLNWDPPALEKIKEGTLEVSVGGHFMIGGWTLVLLYDYHQGRDFIAEGVQLKRPMFGVLYKKNIDAFLSKFGDRNWSKIDFRRFSKTYHPDIKEYDFSPESVIYQ
jgi:ABC-type sugar transport system substrate-binding protein